MKIISITIAMTLLSSPAMAMDNMKASPEPAAHAPAAHAPAVTTPQHPNHPTVVHKHKKHG